MITNLDIPIIKTQDPIALKPEQMATLAAFANHLANLGLGVHCSRCGEDLRGANATIDQVFSVKCGCREFKADNPRQRPATFDERAVEADKYLKSLIS